MEQSIQIQQELVLILADGEKLEVIRTHAVTVCTHVAVCLVPLERSLRDQSDYLVSSDAVVVLSAGLEILLATSTVSRGTIVWMIASGYPCSSTCRFFALHSMLPAIASPVDLL